VGFTISAAPEAMRFSTVPPTPSASLLSSLELSDTPAPCTLNPAP